MNNNLLATIIAFYLSKFNDLNCIYNHRTTKTNQKYPSVNL